MKITTWPSFVFKEPIRQVQDIKRGYDIKQIQDIGQTQDSGNKEIDSKKIYETVALNDTQLSKQPFIQDLFAHEEKTDEKAKKLYQLSEKLKQFEGISFKNPPSFVQSDFIQPSFVKPNFVQPNFVFSDGNYNSKLMLIGEAPGEEEDKLGKPFVGKSGMLLNGYLEALHFDRTKYYITNILPWRPPGNRTPTAEEIEKMKPFVIEHINIIEPKLIVTIGAVALNALGIHEGITKMQGKLCEIMIEDKHYKVFPIYHPSYCLRMPSKKRDLWRSLLKMQEIYAKL